jgi:hypothetical protein
MATVVVAAACSGGQPGAQHRGPYALDTAGDKRILVIYSYGGMEASDHPWVHSEAEFSLYGDGRVILSCAPADGSYPPLLPCLNETHVSPSEIQQIVADADAAGLLTDAGLDIDDNFVTDEDTTVFETTVGGSTHKVEAYALYPQFTNMSRTAAARQRLLAFRADMADLKRLLGRNVDPRPYEATTLRIQATRVDSPAPYDVRPWPLSVDPGGAVNGRSLTGEDMAAFIAAANRATVFTVWQAPSGYYQLSVHPVFPGE